MSMSADLILKLFIQIFTGDETVALEAFKSGAYDFKQENSSKIGLRLITLMQLRTVR